MLTPKREKFCREIVKGSNQSDSYRKSFNAKKMKDKTIHERASWLMAQDKIKTRIQELMGPVVAQVQMSREEWLLEMEKMMRGDVRKMFDEFGNPVEIPHLSDNEAAMVEGFEFEETFTKVKKADGDTDAVPTGYIKKYKLTPKLKRALEFGKVMGWYTEKAKLELGASLEELVMASMKEKE